MSARKRGSSSVIGKALAHYRVVAQLGAGGMGEVYRAQDTKLGREVHWLEELKARVPPANK